MNYYEALKCGKSIEDELDELKKDVKSYKNSLRKDKMNEITKVFVRRMLDKAQKDINNIMFHLSKTKDGDITEEDIARAREYPITQLIEFNKFGKAHAFCHEDKNPSLSYWKAGNKCRCFVCNITFDPIAVLMERDSMNFIDAVKKLR